MITRERQTPENVGDRYNPQRWIWPRQMKTDNFEGTQARPGLTLRLRLGRGKLKFRELSRAVSPYSFHQSTL
jgi:hypothetical protein